MKNRTRKPNYAKYVQAAGDAYIVDRFMENIALDGPDGCWTWRGHANENGYGALYSNTYSVLLAHRLALHIAKRPVPEELVVDHLCRNTLCVNPRHLEPVTSRENILRGVGMGARNARKTHCVNGHEFTTANTRIYTPQRSGNPTRICRKCQAMYYRNRRDRAVSVAH